MKPSMSQLSRPGWPTLGGCRAAAGKGRVGAEQGAVPETSQCICGQGKNWEQAGSLRSFPRDPLTLALCHFPGNAFLPQCLSIPFPASSDNLARLWCVETGEIKREYSGHQKAVVCLAFNDSVLG